jgi:hypothetical protein
LPGENASRPWSESARCGHGEVKTKLKHRTRGETTAQVSLAGTVKG